LTIIKTGGLWSAPNDPAIDGVRRSAIGIKRQAQSGATMARVSRFLVGIIVAVYPITGLVAASSTAFEYYHGGYDHYFVTASPSEIDALDAGTFAGWTRTGESFGVLALNEAASANVCRFWSKQTFAPKSSHFYTPFDWECAITRRDAAWMFEGEAFSIKLADSFGTCAAGTMPLYRLYNDGRGGAPNHRYTTSLTTRAEMIAQGWTAEGSGVGVIGCVPYSSTPASCEEGGVGGSVKALRIPDMWLANDVAVVDIDGDGRADVLTLAMFGTDSLQHEEGRLTVYRRTVSGAFCTPETYVIGGYPWQMVVRDVDGDGAPDVVITDLIRMQMPVLPQALWLLRQDPAQRGRFLTPQLLASTGSTLYTAAVADVNGDGAPDVVVDDGLGTGAGAAVLFQNPGSRGTFRPPQSIALPGEPTYVIAGDANGDNRSDLAFWVITSYVNYTATSSMAMLRQDASGALGAPELSLRNRGVRAQRMAMTDYDGDGLRDVVLFLRPSSADYKGLLVTALQQPLNVYTGIETSLAGVDGIDDAAIADLDGDGWPDVAVAGWWFHQGDVSRARGRVNVFTQSGGGHFAQRAQYDVPLDTVSRIAAGDVDGDGRQDLVLLGGDNECYVMLQSRVAPGAFEPARPLR
jgi:hypothetical protein